ncbi:hypothetical protein BSL78_28526 [Apostichopus japonicus]|uniref:Fumarate hydratase n=1 Tax=Stichopus japonicus TaxID=307972 RepID=A0A2G8JFW6_STIJA|nr:hypothetical protein BSL78_28526 [Apostichopus japonicus]
MKFVDEKIKTLGTAACPPYHLSVVIGGLSAELTLKTVKLASTKYLDTLPTSGNEFGRAFRDIELEEKIHELSRRTGIGAQFGGKYFCHDVRVVRMPRHGASCPVGIGVSCSADRQVKLQKMECFWNSWRLPIKYLPEVEEDQLGGDVVKIDLNQPMSEILRNLSQYPIKTRLSLTGTLGQLAGTSHMQIIREVKDEGSLPQYIKDHPVYYAGPAKTPTGYASGSFGPTTAGRMDSYVDEFQAAGGSMVMLAKGNRSRQVTSACKKHGGFYLGSIGGPAAILAQKLHQEGRGLRISRVRNGSRLEVEVEDFPAFVSSTDKRERLLQEMASGVKKDPGLTLNIDNHSNYAEKQGKKTRQQNISDGYLDDVTGRVI